MTICSSEIKQGYVLIVAIVDGRESRDEGVNVQVRTTFLSSEALKEEERCIN